MIMAIDASTKASGIAIFDDKNLITTKCITASSTDLIKRIQKMTNGIKDVLTEYNNVDEIVLEEVRPDTGIFNLKTHRALMFLQAGIEFMLHDNFPKIKITYLYPSEWRKACGIKTGRGIKRAELKKADIQFVQDVYYISATEDECDAVGIGHAYINNLKNEINWK